MGNADGEARRLGTEPEFSALDITAIAEAVIGGFGGTIISVGKYEKEIADTEFETIRIELDFAYLYTFGRASEQDDYAGESERLPERIPAVIAEQVMQMEIVTPPIPMDRIGMLEPLMETLRKQGGLGTPHSALYAIGLHLNPEMPELDFGTITAYLRAFACLNWWLEWIG